MMNPLFKGGLFAVLLSTCMTTAALANPVQKGSESPVLVAQAMMMKPSDPGFNMMVLEELTKLNMQLQMLAVQGMASSDPEVKKLATEMFESATKMQSSLSALRQATLNKEAGSNR
jgi:hypothetical protein